MPKTCKLQKAAGWLCSLLIYLLAGQSFAQVGNKKVELNTQEIELHAVIEYYSRKTNKIILPNDGVLNSLRSRKAVIILPKELEKMEGVSVEMWDQIFQGILKIYGYTLTQQGNIYRLTTIKDSWKLSLPINKDLDKSQVNPLSEKIVIQVVVLENVIIDNIRALFKYVSDITPPLTLMDKRTMIITTHESNLKNFLQLLEVLDVPAPPDKTIIKRYPLKQASANQIRTHVQAYFNILRARKKSTIDPSTTPFFLPDETTNRLLVSAIPRDHKIVEDFIKFFEEPLEIENEYRPMNIYRLKNSDAESLAKILNQVLKGKLKAPTTPANVKVKPKQEEYSVVPYKELNAIIISVEKKETMKAIIEVIQELDVKRKQVLIRSTIIEVNNSSTFNIGADFGLKSDPGNSTKLGLGVGSSLGTAGLQIDATAGSGNPVTLTPDPTKNGLNLAIPYGRYDVIPFVLNMAETDRKINVLATPSVMCDDNEDALIEITEERSFATTTVSSNGTPITSQGGFNEAGIVLKIKPTISSDKFLKLEIEQNVDRFLNDSGGGGDVRNKRKATTTVTIPDKTSVVFGGLTQRENNKNTNGIPGISKIPLIGKLFQNNGSSRVNNTLYFFITPHIIQEFDELNDITDNFHDELKRSADNDMRNDEIFIGARNDKYDYVKASNKVLGDLFETFNRDNLRKWLKPGVALVFAEDILRRRSQPKDEFLPAYTQVYFDETKLDDAFFETLSEAKKILKDFDAKPKKRQEILVTFDVHLIKTLENLNKKEIKIQNNRRRKVYGEQSSNLIFKVNNK